MLNSTNSSKEHILLNAIGGRLKSKHLLCKSCNSEFGNDSDSYLENQLQFLSSSFQVKRDRGKNQPIKGGKTADGVEYHLIDGSKPVPAKPDVSLKSENGKIEVSVSARNEEELFGILQNIKRKYPGLDIEDAKQKIVHREEYLNTPVSYNISIGGAKAFKSIVKSAVNFYIYSTESKEAVEHLFTYLKGTQDLSVVRHFYPSKSIYRKTPGEVIHLIHIRGDKHKKTLYCYVEFFSSYGFLVLLSDNYSGQNLSTTYCYDIRKNEEVKKVVNLKFKSDGVTVSEKLAKNDYKAITSNLQRVFKILNKEQTDKEISRIVEKAVSKVFDKYSHEPKITKQMISEFSEEIANAYVKFVYRGQSRV